MIGHAYFLLKNAEQKFPKRGWNWMDTVLIMLCS